MKVGAFETLAEAEDDVKNPASGRVDAFDELRHLYWKGRMYEVQYSENR